MTAVADKLREARALIERGWVQGPLATDAAGHHVIPVSETAVCFCMIGATWRVDISDHQMDDLLADAAGVERGAVSKWNDAPGRTQSEVLAAFDKAIELAKQVDA